MPSIGSNYATVAVIGCGQWGSNLIRVFANLGALSAVVDTIPSRANGSVDFLRSTRGYAVSTRTWTSVLADPSITTVVLATPASSHAEMAVKALAAGKHVFIEKPLALTVTDGELVRAAALEAKKMVMVGHSFRYHPAFLELKKLMDTGALGKILHIHSRRLGFGRIRHDGNVFWNLAPHDVSMILGLFDNVQAAVVHTHGDRLLRPNTAIQDVVNAHFTLSNGVNAQVHVSWLNPQKERKLIVIGEGATAVFDDVEPWESKLRIFKNNIDWTSGFPEAAKGQMEMLPLREVELLAEECQHFLDCINAGNVPRTDVNEGIAVVRVLEAVEKAMCVDNPTSQPSSLIPGLRPVSNDDRDVLDDTTSAPQHHSTHIPLIDLPAQRRRICQSLDQRLSLVFDHMNFIMGPEVYELEQRLCAFSGAANAVTCANGTDALTLAMLALGVGRGNAVLVPAMTFIASVEPVVLLGAVPIIVDVEPRTLTIDPTKIAAGFEAAHAAGLRPVGIIAVDLFGNPANYSGIRSAIAKLEGKNLWLIADAAQSFGASVNGSKVGTLADITTTSFFPSKPLGCYGDGGAVFTNNPETASTLRSLRLHGRDEREKFSNVRIGVNSRLDTIQAAVLLCKLDILADEIGLRQVAASRYTRQLQAQATDQRGLDTVLCRPAASPQDGVVSAWSAYAIRTTDVERPHLQKRLNESSIDCVIYYPKPVHKQAAYRQFPVANGSCPEAELACREVLSIPMHPYIEAEAQSRIVSVLTGLT